MNEGDQRFEFSILEKRERKKEREREREREREIER